MPYIFLNMWKTFFEKKSKKKRKLEREKNQKVFKKTQKRIDCHE